MLPSPNWKQRRTSKETHDVAEDPVDCIHERAVGPAVIAPNTALAQLPPLPAALLPVSPAALLPVSPAALLPVSPAALLPVSPAALLLDLGPLTFLVLLASEAVVLASMAVRATFTAAPGPMPTATLESTATPATMA